MVGDEELLDRWRSGDRSAGNELLNRHFNSVHRFFATKVGRATEDLVQRTFERCVEVRDHFEGRSSFRSFLLGIAKNVLREHFRANARDGRNVDFDEAVAVDLDDTPGPATLLVQHQEERLLLEALRAIPLNDQIVLELYYWERLTAIEVGEVLGVPEQAIRSRVRRAKERLGAALERLANSPTLLESTTANLDKWALRIRDALRGRTTPDDSIDPLE